MKRYEYKCEIDRYLNEDEIEELLNEYGKDGWELISVSNESKPHYYRDFYFKRKLTIKNVLSKK